MDLRTLWGALLATALACPHLALAASSTEDILVEELDRAMAVLSAQDEPPHYVALTVEEDRSLTISATDDTLARSSEQLRRFLDVELRVGTPELDSTHPMRGPGAFRFTGRSPVVVPMTDHPDFPLRQALWRELNDRYRAASESIVVLRSSQNVLVAEEDPAPDFEPREPVVDRQPPAPFEVDQAAWEDVLVEVVSRVGRSEAVISTSANLSARTVTDTFVDTEGARIVTGTTHLRVLVAASGIAEDGDQVSAVRYLDVHETAGLPDRAALLTWADEIATKVEALMVAPRGEPYSGPVMLRGKAAGVFFHEVLGHRVEGHRQKRDDEGKTFARYVGRPILPAFIDVYDDPTIERLAGVDLNGYYRYDDEGVPAQRAQVVEDGNFVGFLMSRSPIAGFEHSNGHGRRQVGRPPVARMANLVVESSEPATDDDLRAALIAQIKAQGLPYGVIVDEIQGGFTLTGRVVPNAFNVRASTSWRVYADGRPDELLRGIDLVGTPLVAFGNLVAAGGEVQVFNGFCGAESGSVPVSAVAPSVLFSNLEFQLKEKGTNKPPLLPKPTRAEGGSADASQGVDHEG